MTRMAGWLRVPAALPWHVYVRSGADRKPMESTVSWLLNNRPNAEMSAFAFREVLMVHLPIMLMAVRRRSIAASVKYW